MVGSLTNKPKNSTCGVDKHTLTTLGQEIKLTISEVVAHQFFTFHTKWLEDISRLNCAKSERITDGSGIKRGSCGVATDTRLYPNLFYSDFSGFIDSVSAWLWNNKRFYRSTDRLHNYRLSVDDQRMGGGFKHPARLSIQMSENLLYLTAIETSWC